MGTQINTNRETGSSPSEKKGKTSIDSSGKSETEDILKTQNQSSLWRKRLGRRGTIERKDRLASIKMSVDPYTTE